MANGIKTMLDTLRNKLEHINSELDVLDRVLLKMAKALNPDMPMADGFKANWISCRDAILEKEYYRNNIVLEISSLDSTMFTEWE